MEDFTKQLAEEFNLSQYQVTAIVSAPLRRQAQEMRENTGKTVFHLGFGKFAWKNRVMVQNGKKKSITETSEGDNEGLREDVGPDPRTGGVSGEEA